MDIRHLVFIGLCLLSPLLPVLAHEDRPVDEFEIAFGWQHEPVYTGQMNGPELYLFMKAAADHAHDAGEEQAHADTLEITGETGIPELTLNVSVAEAGGLLVEYAVTNFVFSTANANGPHVEGEGHAHILVDGEEAAMVFGDPVRLPDIAPGEHEIGLQLIANSHEPLTLNGEIISTHVMVMVEGDHDGTMDHEHDDDAALDDMAEGDEADDHGHGDEADMSADEHDGEAVRVPVTDADLQVEVTFGPESVTLRLQPDANEPGHYTAALIPTLPGDYTFRLFGTANGIEIDETFTSADGQFDPVDPVGDILFPVQPSTADLLARIEALEGELAGE